jgi:hypothetical protein
VPTGAGNGSTFSYNICWVEGQFFENCITGSFITCTLRRVRMNGHVKEDEMSRVCSTNEKKRNAYMSLMGKPEGKRLLGRLRRR